MKSKIVRVITAGWKEELSFESKQEAVGRWERREIILPYFDTIRIHGGKAEVVVEQENAPACAGEAGAGKAGQWNTAAAMAFWTLRC